MRLFREKNGSYRLATDKDSEKEVIDTEELDSDHLEELFMRLWQKSPKLANELQLEWAGQSKKKKITLGELLELGEIFDQIEKQLEQKKKDRKKQEKEKQEKDEDEKKDEERKEDKKDEKKSKDEKVKLGSWSAARIKIIRKVLARASRQLFQDKAKNPSMQALRDTVHGYTRRLNALDQRRLDAQTAPFLDLTITQDQRDQYRRDIRSQGTWGGWAEAEQAARRLRARIPIFTVVNGTFRQVTVVGRDHPAAGDWALVHLGNHYEAVQGAQDGAAVGTEARWVETARSGDCLYESIIVVVSRGSAPTNRSLARSIQGLRRVVADDLSDDAINETLRAILLLGDFSGVGKKTARWIRKRRRKARDNDRSANKKLDMLKSLARLVRGYGKIKYKKTEEVQAMMFDDDIVVSANKRDTTNTFAEYLDNVKLGQLAKKLDEIFPAAKKKGQGHDVAKLTDDDRHALEPWIDRLQNTLKQRKDSKPVVHVGSFAAAARALGKGRLIILRGQSTVGHKWHAEQGLLVVLGEALKQGKIPKTVSIAGAKQPCSVCLGVLQRHAAAFRRVYKTVLAFDPGPDKSRKHPKDIEVADEIATAYQEDLGKGQFAEFVKALKKGE